MNIKLDDLLKHSCVISIDNKRYDAFKTNFKDFAIMPRLFTGFKMQMTPYLGTDYKVPTINLPIVGLGFTHAAIVKMAKFLDWQFVCIFEDDAFPCENAISKLEYFLKDIPDETTILKFGHCGIYKHSTTIINGKYLSGFKTWGSHAYIIFKSYYDMYLDVFLKHIICDHEVFNDDMHILITIDNIFIQKNIDANTIGKVKRG